MSHEELEASSPKKGTANASLRTQRRPSKGSRQPSDPSLAIGSNANGPVAGRGRRPSNPKVTPEGAVNAQGWVREPPPVHGAAALTGFADKSTSSGSRVDGDGVDHLSTFENAEGVLCVNSLVPTHSSDLHGTATGQASQRSRASPSRHAGGTLKAEPSLKSLQDTLCRLEADKERSLSHAARCKKTVDRLAMVNAFQTPAVTARLKAAASSESNAALVAEELAECINESHSNTNVLASSGSSSKGQAAEHAAPVAERLESIEVEEATPGQTAGQFCTADGKTWPGSPSSQERCTNGGAGAPSHQPCGQPASSRSGRHQGGNPRSPPPSNSFGHSGHAKRRHSSPVAEHRGALGDPGGGLGGGLQLSGVKAELQSNRQNRPASGTRKAASRSPEPAHTHDYLRRGAPTRAPAAPGGRPRSRSRGPKEMRAEGHHVNCPKGIDGLPGHYTGNQQEKDGSRGPRSMEQKAKAEKGNQGCDVETEGHVAHGSSTSSGTAAHPLAEGTELEGSREGQGAPSMADGNQGGSADATQNLQDSPGKELEEVDEVEVEDVEAGNISKNVKHLRAMMMVIRLWTRTKAKSNEDERGQEDEEDDDYGVAPGEAGDKEAATYSSLDDPVKQVFDVVATVKVRSGQKLCTPKSFESLMMALQEMDQGKSKAYKKIPMSAIREAFQEQIALQISLSSRYGLSAAEASKGMVFETFRTCVHRLFYRPLEKEEDVKQMLLRMDRG